MWFELPTAPANWVPAARHLCRADPKLARIVRGVGPCTLAPRRDYYVALCKAIFNQQISTAVATVLFGRFRNEFPGRRPTPTHFLASHKRDPEILRRCGLSRQKAAYLIDLSEHFISNRIPTRKLSRMSDEQVVETLVAVKGVGRWTAEMFLMFVLNRPDVLPVDDLGLREGVREIYDLPARPTAKELTAMAESWRPFRSVATWYVWRRGLAEAKA